MYKVLLLKVGTQVHVTGRGWGCVGKITRVFPSAGVYHVDTARFAVRPSQETIETFTDQRGC